MTEEIQIITPDIADQHESVVEAIQLQFRNYGGLHNFFGEVVTVKCFEDNSEVREVIASPGEGRIIVVDGGGSLRKALLGDVQAAKAQDNGWAGLIINGAIRDVDVMSGIRLGVQALGSVPLRTVRLGSGQRDVAVNFGGVTIYSGNWIYADNNGVLVARQKLTIVGSVN